MSQFKFNSKNLWFQITMLVLAISAGIGIRLPSSPEALAENIVNTFTTSGLYSVIGILVVSVIGPVYNFVRSRPKLSLSAFLADPNNWVYIVGFVLSIMTLFGIAIPEGTAQEIVRAVYVKDWAAIGGIGLAAIIVPVVRFFMDKNKAAPVQ